MRYICTSIVATCMLAGSTFAATINVPGDYATIQAAVDAVNDGDEVVVAPGIYTSTADSVVNMHGKAITLRASGTPEETIIDGGTVRRGVVFTTNEGSATVLDGFAIMNCKPVVFSGWHGDSGAGVYCVSSSPTIRNCTIQNNETVNSIGAGIACNINSSPLIENCVITHNFYSGAGGGTGAGISCYDASNPTILNCEISHNSCARGAGVACIVPGNWGASGSSPTITGCTISNNIASSNGGGIYCEDSSSPTITGCTISGNTATDSGGGMFSSNSSPTITSCIFSGNTLTTGSGGGVVVNGNSNAEFIGCEFSNNLCQAGAGGGVVVSNSGSANFYGCSILNNVVAADEAGGIWVNWNATALLMNCTISNNSQSDSYSGSRGGGISVRTNSSVTIVACEVTNNTSNNAGGGLNIDGNCTVNITNTNVCANNPDQIYGNWIDNGGNTVAAESCFFDCNDNGIQDSEDVSNGTSYDCDQNGVPDECQPDCDGDGWIDPCDSEGDIDGDGIPDNCEDDCNDNGIPDDTEVKNGWATDCNGNGILDECDIASDPSLDCDGNGILDSCEIENDQSLDCNGNGTLDECDLGGQGPEGAVQWTVAEGGNGHWYQVIVSDGDPTWQESADYAVSIGGHLVTFEVFDEYAWCKDNIVAPPSVIDAWIGLQQEPGSGDPYGWNWITGVPADMTWGWYGNEPNGGGGEDCAYIYCDDPNSSFWFTYRDVPCDTWSGIGHHFIEWDAGSFSFSPDCNANDIPDECDIADGTSNDVNGNGIPDECEVDCNENGVPDHWDIKTGTSEDCNANGIPDECDTADGSSNDVNSNSIPDECEADCNGNGSPDDWDVVTGWSEDCNGNLIPDECDLEVQIPEGAVQWTVEEGGNGNWYKAIIHGEIPFAQAQDIALSMGAQLASVTSQDETDFINLHVAADPSLFTYDVNGCLCGGPYIGGFRDADGDWQWLDGSAWNWTNWHGGNPDGSPDEAQALRLWDFCCKKWVDHQLSGEDGSIVISSVLEWDTTAVYTSADCNTNGIPDECDIADGTSEDINGDGVPDECQCLADIDGSGAVAIDDILAVSGYWGSSIPAGDLNGDGIVAIQDLLIVISEWGPCP